MLQDILWSSEYLVHDTPTVFVSNSDQFDDFVFLGLYKFPSGYYYFRFYQYKPVVRQTEVQYYVLGLLQDKTPRLEGIIERKELT